MPSRPICATLHASPKVRAMQLPAKGWTMKRCVKKIRVLFPDTGKGGMDIDMHYDQAKDIPVVVLRRGAKTVKHYLCICFTRRWIRISAR